LRITLTQRGQWLTIGLNGRLDAEGAGTVSQAVEKAVSHGRRFVELDMSSVDYLSSAGIRILLIHYQQIGRLKGALTLTGVQERVMHILEVAGLYDLLIPAEQYTTGTDNTPAATMNFAGWSVQDFVLDSAGVLIPRFIGKPCTGIVQDTGDLSCEVVPFPPSTIAIGTGALGFDDAQCHDSDGFFIAAGGIAAYKPAGTDQAADYVVYAEDYVPALRAASGLSLSGNFSHLISFACSEGGVIELSALASCMLRIQDKPATGFVLAAECENCVLLACGVLGTKDCNDLNGWLRPWGDEVALSGHIHAAFFPYHPLRLGFVKLKETVAGLFESELLDVVHVEPVAASMQPRPISLLRGVVWFAAIG
jgi:anti-anti-sigma factor